MVAGRLSQHVSDTDHDAWPRPRPRSLTGGGAPPTCRPGALTAPQTWTCLCASPSSWVSLRRPRRPFGRQHPATRQRHPSRPPATACLQLVRQKVTAQWNGGRCCWRRQRRLTVEAGWSFLCVATRPQVSHGCQGFKSGTAVVRAGVHFIALGRSSAMWGKGQHRTARAESRGEERACGTSLVR